MGIRWIYIYNSSKFGEKWKGKSLDSLGTLVLVRSVV